MKLFSSTKLKELPKWLTVSFCTALGGVTTLALSNHNALAVLTVSTLSAGAGAVVVSEQEKKTKQSLASSKFATQPILEAQNLETTSQNKPVVSVDSEDNLELLSYLEAKNIRVEEHRVPQEIDVSSDRLAFFMGSRYSSIKNFYKAIKRNLSTGKKFSFRLAECSQQDIANCTQLGDMLYRSSFLSHYRYLKTEKIITASSQIRGDMINFLTGEWFERYVYQEVSRLLSDKSLKYQDLINAKIRFANGDSFELDLLFFVNQELLWIECKTKSDISDALTRYAKHKKILSIPENRAFVVALDMPDNQALELTQRWQITVVNQNNLIEKISQALNIED